MRNSLSDSTVNVRAQNIAPLQEAESIRGGNPPPLHAPTATVDEHDTILQAIGTVFFRRSRLFVLFHPTQPHPKHHPSEPHQIKQSLSKIAVNERAVGLML